MSRDNCLPFERGETFSGRVTADGAVPTADQVDLASLCGRRYQVHDPLMGGEMVELMIVQYDAAVAGTELTADVLAVDFSVPHKTFTDLAPTAGELAYPLDYKYCGENGTSTGKKIQDGDLVYVVCGGPTYWKTAADPAVGVNVKTGADGQAAAAAAADDFVVGVIQAVENAGGLAVVLIGASRGIE